MKCVVENLQRKHQCRRLFTTVILFVAGTLATAATAIADEADVVAVSITRAHDKSVTFEVTVRHADTGWQHYADRWEIIDPDGNIIAVRTLYHPHVGEQPFTRRLEGVVIPASVHAVTVRTHDSVHQYGGKQMTVILSQ